MQGLVEAKLKPAALTAAAQGNPITGVDLDHLPFAWIEEPPHLKAADSFKRLADVVQSAADQMRQKFGVDLALIIIDTLSASAEIDDANSSAENQKIFNGLSALSAGAGAFVLVVDHFGKNIETGTRGSSAKEDHSDVVLAMLADRDISGTASNTRMALRKLRGGKAGVVVPFDLVVVDVVDGITGEPGTSCIIEWQPSHHAPGPASSRSVPKSLKVFIAAMKAAVSRHGQPAYPFGPTGPEVLAVTEAELRAEFFATYPAESMDSKRKTYNRALKDARAGALVLSREIGGVDHIWFPEPKDEQQHGAETF